MRETKRKKFWKRILTAAAAVLAAAVLACVLYIGNYYHAEESALEAAAYSGQGITVSEEDDRIIFTPDSPWAGLIFYPGGKVQYEAYAPLMEACAEQGLLCVLLHMPGNLAVLDVNAAEGIPEEYPHIESWYMSGHSLGGSMAASYLSRHPDDFQGLILLAAYSTADLKDSGLSVLSVYGSEDGVMNRNSYETYRENLPADFTEFIIPGGCHAYFGCYGAQKGDGTPEITNEEQIQLTAEAIGEFTK